MYGLNQSCFSCVSTSAYGKRRSDSLTLLYAARASFFVMIFTFRIWSSTYPPALPGNIDSWICLCGDGLEVPKHPVNQSVGVVAV